MPRNILSILEQIGADTKRTHKLRILTLHKENTLLQRVIKLALDPYINFYIKKIPKYTTTPIMDGYEYKPLEYALDQLMLLSSHSNHRQADNPRQLSRLVRSVQLSVAATDLAK